MSDNVIRAIAKLGMTLATVDVMLYPFNVDGVNVLAYSLNHAKAIVRDRRTADDAKHAATLARIYPGLVSA